MKNKKSIAWIVLVLFVVGGIAYVVLTEKFSKTEETIVEEPELVVQDNYERDSFEIIGRSLDGREIRAFRFGTGDKSLVFIGAIHGGYEWNTALLVYEVLDYFMADPSRVPNGIEVVVIPVANPDGLHKIMGTSGRFFAEDAPQFNYADEITYEDTVVAGRFNKNNVDLNRNFDCKWKGDAVWRDYGVNGGSEAFSEPEVQALRDFLVSEKPSAVMVFHSASNGVYTSFCEGDPLPGTEELLDAYSKASGYPRYDEFPYYEVTGDIGDWLSTIGVPAISVELSTHTAIEWDKNLAGIKATFKLYSEVE